MSEYRLWYVRRGDQQRGPFPEPLICRFILLGRIGDHDELSLDGTFWRSLSALPDLVTSAKTLLEQHVVDSQGDPDWRAEREKAALRWLDDRKAPDPRGNHQDKPAQSPEQDRRAGEDRRQWPETVEHHAYRENRAVFEQWIRSGSVQYSKVILGIFIPVVLVVVGALFMKPVNPVRVGLKVGKVDCMQAPGRGVDWSGCDKSGMLVVGADLRDAALVGTNFNHAVLQYTDLRHANLRQSNLDGADLAGAKLEGATWVDGRVCAANSVGQCK
jgi:hypothetical protein